MEVITLTTMKQSYFVRLNVHKQGVAHTLLIPVTNQQDVSNMIKIWTAQRWSVEVLDTPFPGQGINASDIGVFSHV